MNDVDYLNRIIKEQKVNKKIVHILFCASSFGTLNLLFKKLTKMSSLVFRFFLLGDLMP